MLGKIYQEDWEIGREVEAVGDLPLQAIIFTRREWQCHNHAVIQPALHFIGLAATVLLPVRWLLGVTGSFIQLVLLLERDQAKTAVWCPC